MIAERCWPGNKGDPEKIPLGGPRRTEAEHPQPRFGEVLSWHSDLLDNQLFKNSYVILP